jgi:hypothetical protein
MPWALHGNSAGCLPGIAVKCMKTEDVATKFRSPAFSHWKLNISSIVISHVSFFMAIQRRFDF